MSRLRVGLGHPRFLRVFSSSTLDRRQVPPVPPEDGYGYPPRDGPPLSPGAGYPPNLTPLPPEAFSSSVTPPQPLCRRAFAAARALPLGVYPQLPQAPPPYDEIVSSISLSLKALSAIGTLNSFSTVAFFYIFFLIFFFSTVHSLWM